MARPGPLGLPRLLARSCTRCPSWLPLRFVLYGRRTRPRVYYATTNPAVTSRHCQKPTRLEGEAEESSRTRLNAGHEPRVSGYLVGMNGAAASTPPAAPGRAPVLRLDIDVSTSPHPPLFYFTKRLFSSLGYQ